MTFLQRRTSTVLTQKLKPTEGVIIKDVNQIVLQMPAIEKKPSDIQGSKEIRRWTIN